MWKWAWEYFDDKKGLRLEKVRDQWFNSQKVNFPFLNF